MKRTYAKFKPKDDGPEELPPPGHPDWEEYCLPLPKGVQVETDPYLCIWYLVVLQAKMDLACQDTRADALEWFKSESQEVGSFKWICGQSHLLDHDWAMEAVSRWEAGEQETAIDSTFRSNLLEPNKNWLTRKENEGTSEEGNQ